MYTQCPACKVVFSMTEENLGAHHGLVRCGRCREVFNAAWNLLDSLPNEPVPGIEAVELRDRDDDSTQTETLDRGGAAHPGVESAVPAAVPGAPMPSEERKASDDWALQWDADETESERPSAGSVGDAMPSTRGAAGDPAPGADEVPPAQPTDRAPGPRGPSPKPAVKPRLGKVADPVLAPDTMVDEEIVIEAPSALWRYDDEADTEAVTLESPVVDARGRLSPAGSGRGDGGTATEVEGSGAGRPARRRSEPRRIPVAPRVGDVRLVEIPYPQPMRAFAWVAVSVLLLVGIIWQGREYYLTDLAEVPSLRAPLSLFCEYAACTVPERTDIKSIDLLGTSVDPHPSAPGALRVSANLVNRANFVQHFPPLEITLTDKAGVVVGRRTYLPHEYHAGAADQMLPNVVERVNIDLAQPSESAVGYEIQLVAK